MRHRAGVTTVPRVLHFEDNAAGLKAIVAYKLAKGAVFVLLGIVVAHELLAGRVETLAMRLSAWIGRLEFLDGVGADISAWVAHEVTPRHVDLALVLLLGDGVVTTIEGIGLHRRQRWAAWLVVLATGALLPFEIFAVVRHPNLLRAATLAINAAIVAYLVWRVLMRQRRRVAARV